MKRYYADAFFVVLPGQPPSGNHMYERNRHNAGQHKKEGVEAYQAGVTLLVKEARPSGWTPGSGFLILNYSFFLSRDVDCTNAIKVIEDGIAAALCPGDNPPRCCTRFDERFLPRAVIKMKSHNPRVEVEIRRDFYGRTFGGPQPVALQDATP